jgi:hypothetical protein
VIDIGIAKDLGLDLSKSDSLTDDVIHDVQDHLLKLKGQNIRTGCIRSAEFLRSRFSFSLRD